jgi:hypothetical protein
VAISGESGEAGYDHRCLLDHRLTLLEAAQQPPRREPRMPARILPCDQQRQLEGLAEAQPADLLRGRLRDEQAGGL